MARNKTAKVTFSLSGDPEVDGILNGQYKWASNTLKFSFPTAKSNYVVPGVPFYGGGELGAGALFYECTTSQKDYIREVWREVAAYSNLSVTEMTETDTDHADIRYAQTDSNDRSYCWRVDNTPDMSGGDVWFARDVITSAMGGADPGYQTFLRGTKGGIIGHHESGHACCLKHPHEANALSDPTTIMDQSIDYVGNTVMSYRTVPHNIFAIGPSGNPQTHMGFDIKAVQFLYGTNTTSNAGADTYAWSGTTGVRQQNNVDRAILPEYDFVLENFYDGNGASTWDVSASKGYTSNQFIDTRVDRWSTFDSAQLTFIGGGGYAWPGSVHIAATSIPPANVLTGPVTNHVIPNPTNQVFTGGGTDYCDFTGPFGNYTPLDLGGGSIRFTDNVGVDGVTVCTNFDFFVFTGPVTKTPADFVGGSSGAMSELLTPVETYDAQITWGAAIAEVAAITDYQAPFVAKTVKWLN